MNDKAQAGMYIIAAIIILALLFVVGYAIKAIFLPVRTVTDQIDSAGNVIDKTYNADNAIYNYEWFKTQYEKIQANREQINNTIEQIKEFKQTYGDVSTWDSSTKDEYNRLNTIKLGLINQDNNLVAEYNARSKMANRAIFENKLPLSVDKILW